MLKEMRFVISYKKKPPSNDPEHQILISVFYVERDEKPSMEEVLKIVENTAETTSSRIPSRLRRGTFKGGVVEFGVRETGNKILVVEERHPCDSYLHLHWGLL